MKRVQTRAARACRFAASAAATLLVAGCGSAYGPGHPESTGHARLDAVSGEIVLPLDEYMFLSTVSEMDLANRAYHLHIGECMNAQGLQYSAATVVPAADRSAGDRRFGVWNVEQARRFGYGIPVSGFDEAAEADAARFGASWEAAVQQCADAPDPDFAGVLPSNDQTADSLAQRLAAEAEVAAAREPAWTSARADWGACLTAEGLTPPAGNEEWISAESRRLLSEQAGAESSEEAIRIATLEAQCNVETGLSQRLADLVAGIQERLIVEHEAALNELREQVQSQRDAMREYVAQHG